MSAERAIKRLARTGAVMLAVATINGCGLRDNEAAAYTRDAALEKCQTLANLPAEEISEAEFLFQVENCRLPTLSQKHRIGLSGIR